MRGVGEFDSDLEEESEEVVGSNMNKITKSGFEKWYKMVDTDGNGVISKSEMLEFLKKQTDIDFIWYKLAPIYLNSRTYR